MKWIVLIMSAMLLSACCCTRPNTAVVDYRDVVVTRPVASPYIIENPYVVTGPAPYVTSYTAFVYDAPLEATDIIVDEY